MVRFYVEEDFCALGELVRPYRGVFVVYDANVRRWVDECVGHIAPYVDVRGRFELVANEDRKTIDTVMDVCDWLLAANADRNSVILNIGGGITSDLGGFAAAIYKRGIRYINVPTTLLAQVDASIGGKTGVNRSGFKNVIGAFRQPEFTYICTRVLETLPEAEYRSGVAELLKTFLISDGAGYADALDAIRTGSLGASHIKAAAAVKAGIVTRDEKESGERRLLNLGHTVGHAVEWLQHADGGIHASGTRILSHGEAVAVGTIQAARISEALGVAEKGLAARLEADFESAGLPTRLLFSGSVLKDAISQDKKASGSSVHFVLLREPGVPEVRPLTVEEIVEILDRQ